MSSESYTGFFIEWIEHYSQFFADCNWYDFTFFALEVEDDRCMGGVELRFVAMGLGFRARWNYSETDKVKDIKERAAEAIREFGLEEDTPRSDAGLDLVHRHTEINHGEGV